MAVIAGLLLLGTVTVYVTGGTGYAFPYVQLIPVMVAAARYRVAGGVVIASIGAFLLGPFMPLDVARGIDQSTINWLTRGLFFVALGGLTGWLFARVSQQQHERERLAREDHGTGLANTVALEEGIEDALASTPESGEAPPFLFLVRITDFFEALDAVGFEMGDGLIAAVAQRIQLAIPGVGRPYRFGRAKIAFIAIDISRGQADRVAAEIKAAGEQSVDVRGVPVRVELCVGGEHVRPEDAGRPHDTLRRAHLALFVAEERHLNHAIYDERFERANREVFYLISHVKGALDAGQFELFYQPKIRLADGIVTGVEALIRWRDPIHGIVASSRFMPKVERTSLIGPVTRFAFQEACRFADDNPGLGVSVNISPRSLYDEWLLDELCDTIERLDVPASSIEIEITESVVAHDPDRAASCLERLRAYGMPLSIDDFGTGYSSFAYLHRLPVTGLKIDRSFVVEQGNDPRVVGILRCVVQAGHELGLEVVAEGIETEAQLTAMREVGCDLAQGFHFAKPQPAAELKRWLERYQASEPQRV